MTPPTQQPQGRKHAYDVFISFSHEDDADRIFNIYDNKGGSEKAGWVQYFQVELEKSLSGDHGMRLPEVYYFPRDTQTGTQWKRATLEVVKRSAVFILIATERSKNSTACLEEIKTFLEATQDDTTPYHQKRLFIVQKFVSRHADYRLDDWALPGHLREVFSSVVYKKFFGTDPVDRNNLFYNYNPRLEGYSREMFVKGLHDLAGEIAEVIFELNNPREIEMPATESLATEVGTAGEERLSRVIYLSDTPEELKPLRESLMRDLKSQGYRVVASLLDFHRFNSHANGLIEPDLAVFIIGGDGQSADSFSHLQPQLLLLKEAEKNKGRRIEKILWAPRQHEPGSDASSAPQLALVPPRAMSPLAPGDITRLPQTRLADVLDLVMEKLNRAQPGEEAIRNQEPVISQVAPIEGNPFPGLRSFDAEDARLFFGRDSQIEAVRGLAAEHGMLFVLGVSGSGKSSLVKCGLTHRLMKDHNQGKWLFASFTPGNDPLGNLARALCRQAVLGPRLIGAYLSDQDPVSGERAVQNSLSLTSLSLADLLSRPGRLQAGERLLLVVDQFEEVFRFARTDSDADSASEQETEAEKQSTQLVRLLLAAAEQGSPHLRIVVTMRSDYLGECSRFRGLPEAVNRAHYLIPRMTRHELEQAICNPVEMAGGRISPGVVSDLIDKISTEQDQLPLFQHTLFRMWHHAVPLAQNGSAPLLSDEVYAEIGSPQSALDRHIDEVFLTLSLRQREIAGWVFRLICKEGLGNRPERHPRSVSDLLSLLNGCLKEPVQEAELLEAIQPFQQEKSCFLSPFRGESQVGEAMVDLIHESVARCWHRLSVWIKEEAEISSFFDHLFEDARTWQLNQRPNSFLLGRERYQYYENLFRQLGKQEIWPSRFHISAEDCETAQEFWRESKIENMRKIRKYTRARIRRRVVVMLTGLLCVGALMGASLYLGEMYHDLEEKETELNDVRESNDSTKRRLTKQEGLLELLWDENQKKEKYLFQTDSIIKNLYADYEEANRKSRESLNKLTEERKEKLDAESLRVQEKERSINDSVRMVRQQRWLLEDRLRHLQKESANALAHSSLKEGTQTELKSRLALTAWALFRESQPHPEDTDIYEALYLACENRQATGISPTDVLKAEALAFARSPDGNQIAIARDQKSILILGNHLEPREEIPYSGTLVKALAFSADGSMIAFGGNRSEVKVWEKGQLKLPLETSLEEVQFLAFGEKGTQLLASDGGRNLAWISEGILMRESLPAGFAVKGMKRWPGHEAILIAAHDGSVWKWACRDQTLTEILHPSQPLTAMDVNHTGEMLALGFEDGRVTLLNLNSLRESEKFFTNNSQVMSLQFSSLGDRLCIQLQTEIFIKNVHSGEELLRLPSKAHLDGSFFLGKQLIACEKNGNLLRPWLLSMDQLAESLCSQMTPFMPLSRKEFDEAGGILLDWPKTICNKGE